MLQITDLTFRIGNRVLFDGATAAIPSGQKVGLVGRNGAGKSTLLSLIRSEISAESGAVSVHPNARIGHVAQEAPGHDISLIDTVMAADTERTSLLAEAETATDPERIAYIHTRLADIGAQSAEARAASLLAGLGFDDAAQKRPCSSFSGGWRMRVALACVLFTAPDLLLLDEPTNYLDLEGVIWLESYLKSYPYTVLIVSHDRGLLNNAVGHILHLTNGKLYRYAGGYDAFEEQRRAALERQMALKSKQEAERRRIEAFVERFRAKESKARQAQSRMKMLARMKPIASVVEDNTIPFDFPKPEPLSSPLITLEGASAAYGDNTPVLKRLDLRVDMDDRIGLLGANGNGKSTFAKLLSGRLTPAEGKLRRPRALKIGYFAQHQLDELIPAASPYDHLEKLLPDMTEARRRARLAAFGFGEDKADRPVNSLSGGEKARLLFALATLEKPQILIMDEPTNHLDVDSREALIHAINGYDGAVLLISHDRHLLEACVDRLWLVGDGKVSPFDGDLDDYRRYLGELRRGSRKTPDGVAQGGSAETSRKAARQKAAADRQRLAPFRKAVEKAEQDVVRHENRRDTLQAKLSDPSLYAQDRTDGPATITDLQKKLARAEEDLAAAEETWLAAEDALHNAENTLKSA